VTPKPHRPGLFAGTRNAFGPLDATIKARIMRYIDSPSPAGWADILGIIVSAKPLRTVWQLVCRADPSFPKKGAADSTAPAEEQWPRFPDALLVARAIRLVTAAAPERVAEER
jgi:hypothetical protein